MSSPEIVRINPTSGPTSGGDIVRIVGRDFSPKIWVRFGDADAEVIFFNRDTEEHVVDVRTPSNEPGYISVKLSNLDEDVQPIPGEEAILSDAYRYLREEIVKESILTRLIRRLLRELKKQILKNTSLTVSLNHDDTYIDGMNIITMAELPSVVLSGSRLRENKFYGTCEPRESVELGELGYEIVRYRPPYTVDLEFTLTVASNSTVELLNLMAAAATFLNRNRWLYVPRSADNPISDKVRWEMDPLGEFQTNLSGVDDVRAFTCGFVVRGFDIDEGLPLDASTLVEETRVDAESINNGGE